MPILFFLRLFSDSHANVDTADVADGTFSVLDDILSRLNGRPINVEGFTDNAIDELNGFRDQHDLMIELAGLLRLRILTTLPS